MADYYNLIANAVSRHPGDRRPLYERARIALTARLQQVDPPLSAADIAWERQALEAAILRVEGGLASTQRQAPNNQSNIQSPQPIALDDTDYRAPPKQPNYPAAN
jgi:hypothetical protein